MSCKYCAMKPRSKYYTQADLIRHCEPSLKQVEDARIIVNIEYDELGNPMLVADYDNCDEAMCVNVPIKYCPMCGERL